MCSTSGTRGAVISSPPSISFVFTLVFFHLFPPCRCSFWKARDAFSQSFTVPYAQALGPLATDARLSPFPPPLVDLVLTAFPQRFPKLH